MPQKCVDLLLEGMFKVKEKVTNGNNERIII
jgi:hypothetical protein